MKKLAFATIYLVLLSLLVAQKAETKSATDTKPKASEKKLVPRPILLAQAAKAKRDDDGEGQASTSKENDIEDEIEQELEELDESEKDTPQDVINTANISNNNLVIDRSSLPHIFASGDFTGGWDVNKDNKVTDNTANLRESEFGFSTGVDYLMTGVAYFAVHNENGAFFAEMHEAYVEFNRLPYNFYAKVGRFFLDVGRINSIHRHDWVFSDAPMVHERLFDDEAVLDFGGELSWINPYFPIYQEIKLGVFAGRVFGHAHSDGPDKPNPLYTARLKHFLPLFNSGGLEWGMTAMRYNPSTDPGDVDVTFGTDLTFRWQFGRITSLTWSSEIWYRQYERRLFELENDFGFYSYLLYQPTQVWYLGFRLDFFRQDKKANPQGGHFSPTYNGQSVWVTYQASEFSRIRLTGERQEDFFRTVDNYLVKAQMVFMIGFHKPHKF